MKINFIIPALLLVLLPCTPVAGHTDSCPDYLNTSLVREVIALTIFQPEGDPFSYTPSTIYYNCFGNSRELGKYSSLSATLDFELDGELRYTREDFTCEDNQWKPNGLATEYYNPSEIPSQSRSTSYFKKDCALCAKTESTDDYHCTDCSEVCNNTVANYPACFGTGNDKCCNLLLGDYCVNTCPYRYTVSSQNPYSCVCADFWTGDKCETCSLSCVNGGTLSGDCSGCMCTLGFSGVQCETEIDYCSPMPCLNNGTCSYDRYGYNCSCAPGFTDTQCSTEIDFCYPFPCANFAVCKNSPYGFTCQCQEGTFGSLCENIDYCFSNPCKHNGICSDYTDRFECLCPDGYLGMTCEIIDHCYLSMCENFATCVNYPDIYECNCTEGFFGELCQYEVTPCNPNPCLNHGLCSEDTNAGDGFVCNCQNAYTGKICDKEIDHCENVTCHNNGTCSNEFYGFLCNCRVGYTGRNCEAEIDYCASDPCINGGECSYDKYGYHCSCPAGFFGINCSEIICEPSPCKNNGTCYSTAIGYNCSCELGYSGVNCEIDIDYCKDSPCKRGKCFETVGGYRCICEIGYTGQNCSQLIEECSEGVCLNGGNCTELNGNFSCDCRDPFTGRQCERIDPDKICNHLSCENGGRCNYSLLQTADQSQLKQLLDGQQTDVNACECEGHWEGTFCDKCAICEKSHSDCSKCDCKGLWSGPDCTDCSGHKTSQGECVESPNDSSDTTNIIPILIPSLLGLGGIGSLPFIACISFKCKKSCKRRRRPKINVHVIHRDPESNGISKLKKNDKIKLKDQVSQQLCTLTNECEFSPTRSIVSEFTSSEKSKHSDLPEYLASGVYDRLPPISDSHRSVPARFGSQGSGCLKVKLRSPLTSVPDESELRLIESSEQSEERIKRGYTNPSESSSTEHAI